MTSHGKFWSPAFMSEFKKWIDHKEDEVVNIAKGSFVNTNLKLKTLVERIDCIKTSDNTVVDIAKNFIKHGGLVKEVNQEEVIIKTKKGIFILNKSDIYCV